MTVDTEAIKKSMDDFENEKYTDSKDTLRDEIGKARDEFLKDKLGLEKDWNEPETKTEEE